MRFFHKMEKTRDRCACASLLLVISPILIKLMVLSDISLIRKNFFYRKKTKINQQYWLVDLLKSSKWHPLCMHAASRCSPVAGSHFQPPHSTSDGRILHWSSHLTRVPHKNMFVVASDILKNVHNWETK